MAEYPEAIDYYVDESRVFIDQNSHSAITVHGTGGNAAQTVQQLGDYFRTNGEMVSSHFGIDRAGNVAQFVLLKDGSGANCCVMPGHDPFWDQFGGDNLNLHTISVEHENDISNSLPLTDAQKQASFKLIAWLCDKFDIASDHIKSHASIDPINRSRCPGPAYPWDELFTYLQSTQGGPMVPTGWKDTGTTLTAPNGHTVTLGFRDYALSHQWDSNNWPLEEAHGQDPLELSNPSLGHGTQQIFRTTVLEWTPSGGVFVSWVGQELLALRAKLAQDKAETPVVTVNTAQAVSSIQASIAALQSALHTLEPS